MEDEFKRELAEIKFWHKKMLQVDTSNLTDSEKSGHALRVQLQRKIISDLCKAVGK